MKIMKRRRHRSGMLSALHLRELSPTPFWHTPFRTAAYSALVPSSTFISVSAVPPVAFRRFTPCGRYLVALSRNSRDLILYRFETGGARHISAAPLTRTTTSPPNFDSVAYNPAAQDPNSDASRSLTNDRSVSCTPRLLDSALRTPSLPSSHPAVAHPAAAAFAATANAAAAAAASAQHGSRPAAARLLETLPVPILGEGAATTPPTRPQSRESVAQQYSCSFSRFFTEVCQLCVAPVAETLVPDFCLATPTGRFLILASYVAAEDPQGAARVPVAAAVRGGIPAVAGVPVLERFTLSLVDVHQELIADRFVLSDDFVVLEGHGGVHMFGDVLCVLSMRHQVLHVIKVQENLGRFTEQVKIGAMCRSDDELEIARVRDAELSYQRNERERNIQRQVDSHFPFDARTGNGAETVDESARKTSPSRAAALTPLVVTPSARLGRVRTPEPMLEGARGRSRHPQPRIGGTHTDAPPTETGLGNGKLKKGFYTGLMQRLLVYLYKRYHRSRNQERFYRLFEQYTQLVMLKAQFLDEDHLLIRLGTHERNAKIADPATATWFFVIYCISSASILNLFNNCSTDLLSIFRKYRDVFIGDAAVSATLPPARGRGDGEGDGNGSGLQINNGIERGMGEADGEQERPHRSGAAAVDRQMHFRRIRAELAILPVSCQTRNVSPFLDRKLFSYNIDRISALDGTRALYFRELNTVKFMSVESGALRFKLSPGIPAALLERSRREGGGIRDGGVIHMQRKCKALFLFHPFYPFVISMEYSLVMPTTYNFHVYGHV